MAATVRLRIEGMTCGGCVARVEKALRGVTGVSDARVNLTTQVASIETDGPPIDRASLIQAVRDAGYDADTVRAGDAATTDVEGKIYTVWLTGHFVERFEVDLPDRPAAKGAISEEAVRTAIEQALSSMPERFAVS